jgi:calcium-dependent protein kinase
MLRFLDHPSILKIHEVYPEDKRIYIVTEQCTGGELFDELNMRSFFEEPEAAKLVQQLLSAAAYIHNQGVVHRDLKLENILIDSKKSLVIKLSDFGASTFFKKQDKLITDCIGTPYYVAPEVLLGEYDEKCDLWSIGVISYMLLTGRPPFVGETEFDIVK